MNIFEQYAEGDFFSLAYFEEKFVGLPPSAHVILWRRENERVRCEQDAFIEQQRADRLLEETFVKLATITDRFGLDESDLEEVN